MRLPSLVLLATVVAVPLGAQQQTGPIIKSGGAHAPVANPSFEVPVDLVYRVVWDINVGSPKADQANAAFDVPARFLNQAAILGVPRANAGAAVVVHGTAGEELLGHAEYRRRKGTDNPNAALLEEMAKAGVRIILCGQTAASRKIPREELLPFVQVAPSAAWAHAVLLRQGYTANPF